MDVSIILVSYNTKDLTRDCIKSVYDKTQGVEFEIFVVDNNSHDGSSEMIEQEFPQVRLIKNPDNKGFGAANNIAIRLSNAKYIFCLNTDTVLLNNAVKIFFDFMEKPENQNVAACGGQLYDKNLKPTHSVGNFACPLRSFFKLGFCYIFKNYYNEHLSPAKIINCKNIIEVDYISGADLFLRKSVLLKVGIFDEQFFMYGEESDLCYQLKKNHYNIKFLPDTKIIHFIGQSIGKNVDNLNKLKMHHISEIYYFRKNHGIASVYLLKFVYFLIYGSKCIFKLEKKYFKLLETLLRY